MLKKLCIYLGVVIIGAVISTTPVFAQSSPGSLPDPGDCNKNSQTKSPIMLLLERLDSVLEQYKTAVGEHQAFNKTVLFYTLEDAKKIFKSMVRSNKNLAQNQINMIKMYQELYKKLGKKTDQNIIGHTLYLQKIARDDFHLITKIQNITGSLETIEVRNDMQLQASIARKIWIRLHDNILPLTGLLLKNRTELRNFCKLPPKIIITTHFDFNRLPFS